MIDRIGSEYRYKLIEIVRSELSRRKFMNTFFMFEATTTKINNFQRALCRVPKQDILNSAVSKTKG